MNTGNVTVKRTTSMLLAAYIANRKALVESTDQATHVLPAGTDRQCKIGLDIPLENIWR
jgi:hypothetical protein